MALGAAVAVPVAMAIYGQRRASQAALDIPDPYRTPRDVVDAATGLVGEVSRRLLGARGGDAAQRPIDAPTTAQGPDQPSQSSIHTHSCFCCVKS